MGSRILISLILTVAFASLICSVVAARDLAGTTPKTEVASLDGGSHSQYVASANSRGGGSHDYGGGESYKAWPCRSAAEAQALKASKIKPQN